MQLKNKVSNKLQPTFKGFYNNTLYNYLSMRIDFPYKVTTQK
jgi:hypothetical protein